MTQSGRDALTLVRGYATAGRIIVSNHAKIRMSQRGVSHADLRAALTGATGCVPVGERWKVDGPDQDGDLLTCVVALDGGVVVVTVF